MLLETSNTTSNFDKPKIKKGYYPGKLKSVKLFADKDGVPIIGVYGKKLIFEFEVYKIDSTTEQLTNDNGENIVMSKFVYHEYKNTAKDGTWNEGDYRTAITPNSKGITKVLKSLGWTFSEEKVNPELYIGKFVELNIDDYEFGKDPDKYIASTIKEVGVLEIENKGSGNPVKPVVISEENQKKINELVVQKDKLKNLLDSENLSEDGYKQGIEQLDSQIRELQK